MCRRMRTGQNNSNWKGGVVVLHDRGYIRIYHPSHPRANNRGYVYQHRLLAEKAVGKILPESVPIHHHDKIQLVICEDQDYHMVLHQRTRALRACGHANWRKCKLCKRYGSVERLTIGKKSGCVHPSCSNEYRRKKKYRYKPKEQEKECLK